MKARIRAKIEKRFLDAMSYHHRYWDWDRHDYVETYRDNTAVLSGKFMKRFYNRFLVEQRFPKFWNNDMVLNYWSRLGKFNTTRKYSLFATCYDESRDFLVDIVCESPRPEYYVEKTFDTCVITDTEEDEVF